MQDTAPLIHYYHQLSMSEIKLYPIELLNFLKNSVWHLNLKQNCFLQFNFGIQPLVLNFPVEYFTRSITVFLEQFYLK